MMQKNIFYSLHWESNPGSPVYKTGAVPLCYRGKLSPRLEYFTNFYKRRGDHPESNRNHVRPKHVYYLYTMVPLY